MEVFKSGDNLWLDNGAPAKKIESLLAVEGNVQEEGEQNDGEEKEE